MACNEITRSGSYSGREPPKSSYFSHIKTILHYKIDLPYITYLQQNCYYTKLRWPSVLDFPGQSSISGSCPGFHGVLDLNFEVFWVTLHWKMCIVHPAGLKTARNLVSWFSAKSLKLLPQEDRVQGSSAPNSILAGALGELTALPQSL